jgi:hypothetical protein
MKGGDDYLFKLREDVFAVSLNEFGPPDGVAMDFTTTDIASVPIVSERLKDALCEFEGIHFFPLVIDGRNKADRYYALTFGNFLDCVDEKKSVLSIIAGDDPIRPDRAGDYSSIIKLIVDPYRCSDCDFLRLKKASTVLVVSERVKTTLNAGSFTGLDFRLCSED